MALAAATVLEVRPGGSDTNAGGWVTGSSGVDRSQHDSPQYAVTDAVTAGTTEMMRCGRCAAGTASASATRTAIKNTFGYRIVVRSL